jgi:hypothetical protein
MQSLNREGILVRTSHHYRGNCERCDGLTWSDDLEMYGSFERSDTKKVCGSPKCKMCIRKIFSRDPCKVMEPEEDWET